MAPSALDDGQIPRGAVPPLSAPPEVATGDDSRVRNTLWSLSWPTVATVLGILAWLAFSAISAVLAHYQSFRSGSWAASTPVATAVTRVNVWRAVGYLIPLAVGVVVTVLAAGFVFVQRRRASVVASWWRRIIVGLATIWLIGFGLWIVAAALNATLSNTPYAWLVRAAGCVLGLLIAGASLWVLRSKAFRLPGWTYLPVMFLVVAMTLSANFADTTDVPNFGNWAATGFTSLTYVATGTSYWGIDCPDQSTCVGEGLVWGGEAATVSTSDSGRTWVRHESNSPAPVFAWLSCWDATHCVGARGGTVITTDGGKSWQSTKVPQYYSSQAVECGVPETCVIVGSLVAPNLRGRPAPPPIAEVLVTHDGGVTWTPGVLPPGTWDLYSVTCATTSRCFATGTLTRDNTSPGAILETEDGGLTWSDDNAPAGAPLLSDMSCADASHCVAVGSTRVANAPQAAFAVQTDDGGVTWSLSQIPGRNNVIRVACSGVKRCLAAGQGPQRTVIFDTNDGGVSWQSNGIRFPAQSGYETPAVGISCTEEGFCMAFSGTFAATSTDAGVHWRMVK